MRDRVIAAALFGALALSAQGKETAMAETVIEGMKLTLAAPKTLTRAQADPESPAYAPFEAMLTLTFANASAAPIAAPLQEIEAGVVLVYATPEHPDPVIDNKVPPPPADGPVTTLAPGESRALRLGLGYPAALIAPTAEKPTALRVCLRWQADWLRAKNYAPGAVGWNHSFEICETVEITRD